MAHTTSRLITGFEVGGTDCKISTTARFFHGFVHEFMVGGVDVSNTVKIAMLAVDNSNSRMGSVTGAILEKKNKEGASAAAAQSAQQVASV